MIVDDFYLHFILWLVSGSTVWYRLKLVDIFKMWVIMMPLYHTLIGMTEKDIGLEKFLMGGYLRL